VYLDGELLKHEPFLRYLTSLGLTYENGTRKPGYDVFKHEVAKYRQLAKQSPPRKPQAEPPGGSKDVGIEGTWTLVSLELAGQKFPGFAGSKLVMAKGKKTFTTRRAKKLRRPVNVEDSCTSES